MFFGGVAQVIENHSRLHPGRAPRGINFHDISHVAGEIEHQGYIATLAGKRGSATAAQQGRAILACDGNRGAG